MRRFQEGWILLLLALFLGYAVNGEEFCNCEYTIPADFEPHCRVFGELGDEQAFPWLLASEKCVAELNVSESTLTREDLWLICPFANSTNVNVQLLRNQVESGTSDAANTIRSLLPQFFQPEGVDSSTYVLQDSFFDNRNSLVNCQTSETLCWSVIRDHLTYNADARGLACQTLHSYQKGSMADEQLRARSALCTFGEGIPESCTNLHQQIETTLEEEGLSCGVVSAPAATPTEQCDWTNPMPQSGSATSLLRAPLFLTLVFALVASFV